MKTITIVAAFIATGVAVTATVAFAQPTNRGGNAMTTSQQQETIRHAVTYARVLDVPAQRVWATVSDADSWAEWIPFLSASECEGDHAGATRVCVMVDPGNKMGLDGYRLQETILENNADTMTFRYAIANPPLPLTGFEGTVQVMPQGEQSIVFWTANFDAAPEASKQNQQMLVQMYHGGLLGLESYTSN